MIINQFFFKPSIQIVYIQTVILIFLFQIGWSINGIGQCPSDNGLTIFNTQQEIDDFASIYPNCTELSGLRILGVSKEEITNLSGLTQLIRVQESGIVIAGNHALSDLKGLENLRSVQGDFLIQDNLILSALAGLDRLTNITADFIIKDNPTLNTLSDLVALRLLGGLEINNTSLQNLKGLEQITNIESDILLRGNALLADLAALQNLQTIAGTLWCWENEQLESLRDLSQLETIGSVSLRGNSQLADCQIPALCNLVGETFAELVIRDNDCGCSGEAEVIAACNGFEGLPICQSKNITLPIVANENVRLRPIDVDGGSFDDCSFDLALDRTAFSCNDVGEQQVTLTVTDNEGNSSTCSAIVSVQDVNNLCAAIDIPLEIGFPNLDFPCESTTIAVPVIVADFINITALQFSVTWDTTVLQLDNIENIGIPSISIQEDFLIAQGVMSFGWLESSFIPVTLDAESILFELVFSIRERKSTTIQFTNTPSTIEAVDDSLVPIEVSVSDGNLMQNCPDLPIDSLNNNSCCPESPNLIGNGDFEIPNTSIINDYTLQTNVQINALLPGNYGILSMQDANTICQQWLVDDHSTNCDSLGNFLVVNGRTGQGANAQAVIWQQTIDSLELDLEYTLCAYVKNLQQCCFDNAPMLYVKVDGQPIDTIFLSQSGTNDPCNWEEFNASFVATNTSQTISICIDESRLGDGNDIALDDIALSALAPANLYFSVQDQRPSAPNFLASINLITAVDDTLPSPECTYKWTVAKIDSLDIANQEIFLNQNTIQIGDASTGWNLTTTFPGYNGGVLEGNFDEGLYYVELDISNCACIGDTKEIKILGWKIFQKLDLPPDVPWKLILKDE